MRKLFSLALALCLTIGLFVVPAVAESTTATIEVCGNTITPYFRINEEVVLCAEPYVLAPDNGELYCECGELPNDVFQRFFLHCTEINLNWNDDEACMTAQQAIWSLLDDTRDWRLNVSLWIGTQSALELFDELTANLPDEAHNIELHWYEPVEGSYQVMVGGECVELPDETPEPTEVPTPEPTMEPTPLPTEEPTPVPTEEPTPVPTEEPTPVPTEEPTPVPTEEPTPVPTEEPTPVPTEEPTPVPTEEPTPVPTEEPTPVPTQEPTPVPTEEPTPEPTEKPVVPEEPVIPEEPTEPPVEPTEPEPTEPVIPDEPVVPDEPIVPEEPDEPEVLSDDDPGVPRTGDVEIFWIGFLLVIAGQLVLLLALADRKRRRHNN